MAKVSRAFACGAMRTRTDSAHTGSRPVLSVTMASRPDASPAVGATGCSGAGINVAAGWLAGWFRPSHCWRSVWTSRLVTSACTSARKCAAFNAGSEGRRGLRSNSRACCVACHCACTKRLLNAGWASSARGSVRVMSNAEISSISSASSPLLRISIWRNSTSSSGLTQTVVCVCT